MIGELISILNQMMRGYNEKNKTRRPKNNNR
jgi:hypothetical protein